MPPTILSKASTSPPGSVSGQIRHRAGAFNELFQGSHDGGASKEFAEEVDLAPQIIVWNRLDKSLGGGTRYRIVLGNLRCGRAGDSKDLAFASKLRHQSDGLRTSRVNRSSGKKQIPDEGIAKIAF